MSDTHIPADASDTHTNPRSSTATRVPRQTLITVLTLSLLAVQPAAAQGGVVCNADNLPQMIEGFFQLTTGLGILGLAIVWQADSLIEMFRITPDDKRVVRRHKRSALKSAVILVALGPMYTVAGSTMGLPLAECIDLVPW